MASDNVQVLTDQNFEETVLAASRPVLVDFWAQWCGPCRRLLPIVDALAEELHGSIIVAKLNVDENPQTAGRFGIRGIPTLLLFKRGQVVESIMGLADKAHLRGAIQRHVS
jgi:thioredoxin 1